MIVGMGPGNLNEQFNQQYDEMIDTVKSRALWRVGERIDEGETFRCRCPNCGYESLHQRFDITRTRLLFGKAIREIESPRPMLRCRRCGIQRHLRDVDELVAPTTIALHDEVITRATALAPRLRGDADASTDDLVAAISALNDEASGPVRTDTFGEIAQLIGPGHDAVLETVGRALFLTTSQIAGALDAD